MVKLKTLKNIKFSYPEVYDEEYRKDFDKENLENIKIEAINHIKRLKSTALQRNNKFFQPTIDWIKYWFNIKEKEV